MDAPNHLPMDAEGWSVAEKIAYLERMADRGSHAAGSGKHWPHHAEQESRYAQEARAQAQALRTGGP